MELKYANVGKRVAGGIVDLILIVIFYALYVRIFGTLLPDHSYHISGFTALLLFLIIFLYFVILEKMFGKTLGKLVAKTKVVDQEGKLITWGQSIARNLMRVIDGMFLYLVAFIAVLASKSNRRLGDMVAKTFVIEG